VQVTALTCPYDTVTLAGSGTSYSAAPANPNVTVFQALSKTWTLTMSQTLSSCGGYTITSDVVWVSASATAAAAETITVTPTWTSYGAAGNIAQGAYTVILTVDYASAPGTALNTKPTHSFIVQVNTNPCGTTTFVAQTWADPYLTRKVLESPGQSATFTEFTTAAETAYFASDGLTCGTVNYSLASSAYLSLSVKTLTLLSTSATDVA